MTAPSSESARGTDRAFVPWRARRELWHAGDFSAELDGAGIADVRFRGALVLTAIRAVIRDHDWNTLALVVDDATITETSLGLAVRCTEPGVDLAGSFDVHLDGARLTTAFDLRVGCGFETNRVGLVVLHPAAVSGAALTVRHADGSVQTAAFPTAVSPHQPVLDIAGLGWAVCRANTDSASELRAQLVFDGDVFEMEDQRNWTDASYKTYSRPLALPFPYLLEAGTRVRQSVRLELEERPIHRREPYGLKRPNSTGSRERCDSIVLASDGAFPAIGSGVSTAPDPAPAELDAIGSFRLVELDLATPNWRAALLRAALGTLPLDVRIVFDDEDLDSLDDAASMLAGMRLVRAAAFRRTGAARDVSDAPLVAALRTAFARAGVEVPIVGGARSHFTELNRERDRLPSDLDGVVFATTPLFHEIGTDQLIASLAMQRIVAAQAVAESRGVPVHIGPIALRPRYNNVATTPQPQAPDATLRHGYGAQFAHADDPRQGAQELAAWTIASAAALAVPGVSSLTFYEEWGPRGIADRSGADYPVAASVRSLAELAGTRLLHGDSLDGLMWAVGSRSGDQDTVLVANLDDRQREVTVVSPAASVSVTIEPTSWCRVG
jgi:hypothetical protein